MILPYLVLSDLWIPYNTDQHFSSDQMTTIFQVSVFLLCIYVLVSFVVPFTIKETYNQWSQVSDFWKGLRETFVRATWKGVNIP